MHLPSSGESVFLHSVCLLSAAEEYVAGGEALVINVSPIASMVNSDR